MHILYMYVILFLFIDTCTEGALRLVNGSSMNEGRIEICQHSVWGTICDDFFSRVDARVVCRNLGLNERCKSINIETCSMLFLNIITKLKFQEEFNM